MINPHDPHPLILEELFSRNEVTEDKIIKALKDTQKYVIDLRRSYSNTPCHVNYENKYLRAAYMLAYFPYYIETVHRVLDDVDVNALRGIFTRNMNVCFYGAGPAPELLGLLSYLNLHQPAVQRITSYLFDAATQWDTCREICTNVLAPYYWQGRVDINSIHCNILACNTCGHHLCYRVIPSAHLHIMQNCLNDIIGDPVGVINTFRELFTKLSRNSIFIIIDLNFVGIRDLLNDIAHDIVSQRLGIIIKPVCSQNEWFKSCINLPQVLIDNIFDSGPETIPRLYTRYYSLVLMRK